MTLFAQVPDWKGSRLKSSAEILQAYGYETPEGRKLSCTLSVKAANSQSLFLHVDRDTETLHARSDELDPEDVVSWPLEKLRSRFVHKHSETVWVEAITKTDGARRWSGSLLWSIRPAPRPKCSFLWCAGGGSVSTSFCGKAVTKVTSSRSRNLTEMTFLKDRGDSY